MSKTTRLLLASLAMALAAGAPAQTPARLGAFEAHTDVGAVRHAGRATYDARTGEYTVSGSGANMWAERDAFHFVWRRLSGDFILTARARLVGAGGDPHRKLGWTVRASLAADAPHATAAVHGDGLAALQFRRAAGGTTEERRSPVPAPDVVQLERRGGTIMMSVARFGEPFTTTRVDSLALGDTLYVGLFVCAHDDAAVERGVFRDVRLTVPAAAGFQPYRDYLGARIEVMEVETGRRTVVHESARAAQAPNWTPDGRALIYNEDGRLFRFDLARRDVTRIETGFATSNNNDHVLSFDGRTIAISHHVADDGNRSVVFTVPVGGGVPTRVTPRAPSYLHGWSPDGRYLVYTGERGGVFDVYRIPVTGGEETRLTTAPGLDDGPEYTPDGRWIYFNSSRTGRMQIWRMRPDGSAQEQVTNGELNDWFPHVSPDGRWIVFLSYLPDVRADDHPWYRPVYLRLMPIAGGTPRVIAYVYGGQGTINVPSWSPDSRRIAFVSNSGPVK